jgi:hypothetical protein
MSTGRNVQRPALYTRRWGIGGRRSWRGGQQQAERQPGNQKSHAKMMRVWFQVPASTSTGKLSGLCRSAGVPACEFCQRLAARKRTGWETRGDPGASELHSQLHNPMHRSSPSLLWRRGLERGGRCKARSRAAFLHFLCLLATISLSFEFASDFRASLRPSKIACKMASISEPRNTRNTRKKDLFVRVFAYSAYSAVSSVRFGSGNARLGFRIWDFLPLRVCEKIVLQRYVAPAHRDFSNSRQPDYWIRRD